MAMWPRRRRKSYLQSKQKKSFAEAMVLKTTTQPKVKSTKKSFDSYTHKHLWVVIEASIKLSGVNPVQEFIVNLQELLKNGPLVDKMFAFCFLPNGP
jgi:hypothetical protein